MATPTSYYDVIQNHLSYFKQGIFTSLPAVVEEYFPDTQTINARVVVPQLFEDGLLGEPPITYGVPVMFPSSGGGMISFPIDKGDTVLLIYSMRDMTNWLDGDGTNNGTRTTRTHSNSDAIAIVGLFADNQDKPEASTDSVKIQYKNTNIELRANGIFVDGDVTVSGDVIANKSSVNPLGPVSLLEHTHGYIDNIGQPPAPTAATTQEPNTPAQPPTP